MIGLLIGLGGIFLIIVLAELLWHQNIFHGEVARKFIHMLAGSYIAFWPLLMPMPVIMALSAAFIVVLLLAKRYKIFRAMHNVQRKTWGDVLFAAGIGLSAYLVHTMNVSVGLFTVAILHMACADGLAAIVGMRAKKNISYKTILKHKKSVVGTFVFWSVSVLIITAYAYFTDEISFAAIIPIFFTVSILLTVLENIAVYGLDNILVPVASVLLLMPYTIRFG